MWVKFLRMNQPVCVVLWVAIIINLLLPFPGILSTILLYAGAILLIGHFLEWLMLKKQLDVLGHGGMKPFVMVMIYGFFWWIPVIRHHQS